MVMKSRSGGVVTTEFLMVFPTFFVMLLCTLEFSLMLTDRHLLHSAAISAARSVLLDKAEAVLRSDIARVSQSRPVPSAISATNCLTSPYAKTMRRRAAMKMASNAPSLFFMLSRTGFTGASEIENKLGSLRNQSIVRLMLSYPTAFLLTRIDSCNYDNDGVTLKVTYFRNIQMPFIGRVIWALKTLSDMTTKVNNAFSRNPHSTASQIKTNITLDNNFFKVQIDSNVSSARAEMIAELRSQLTQFGGSANDFVSLFSSLPVMDELASDIGGAVDKFYSDAASGITALDSFAGSAEASTINGFEKALTVALYTLPESVMFIPMTRTVHLAWPGRNIKRFGESPDWDPAFNRFVAPYHGDGSIASDWESWSRTLAKHAIPNN